MVQDGKLAHIIVPAINNQNGLPVTPTFKANGFRYWCIKHDKDVHDDGSLKTVHYHVIFEVNDRHRNTFYFELAKTFFSNITSYAQITCNVLLNKQKRSNIRYLVHADDDSKARYNKDDVITNDRTTLTNCLTDAFTIDYLLEVVNNSDTLTDVMKVIGLDTYKVYSHAIDIIWKENK